MPPSRSDRWQANFLVKKFAQSDSNHGLPRRTAGLLPGVQLVFYITRYFLGDITSVRLTWFFTFFPFFTILKYQFFL